MPEKFHMLKSVEWMQLNNTCHVLVDEEKQLLAALTTEFDFEDGDFNILWNAEVFAEPIGCFVGVQTAKWAVQKFIAFNENSKAAHLKKIEIHKKKLAAVKKKIKSVQKTITTKTNKKDKIQARAK